jgi:hypothetical protein
MKKNSVKALLAGCIFFLLSVSLPADELPSADAPVPADETVAKVKSPNSAVLVFYHQGRDQVSPDLYANIDYTVYSIDAAFYDAEVEVQIPYINGNADSFTSKELQRYCDDAGARWAITVYTTYSNERLTWRFSVYDAEDNFVRVSEAFWMPLSAGVSADIPIDTSVANLVLNYSQSFHTAEFNGESAVSIPQKFIAPEDGIEVFFGEENAVSAGIIENGGLTAPIFLFVEGRPVYGIAVKDGYWPQPFTFPGGITEETVALSKPVKKARQSLSLMTELRNIPSTPPKYAIDFDYRFYPLPDRWFFKLGYALLQEEIPLEIDRGRLFQELRFGTGLYILPQRTFPFRLLVGTGISAVFVDNASHFLADPLWFGAEYHFSRFALISEVRLPEIFTYSRNAFGSELSDFGYCISFGVMLKW